jgi:hypothetical protein
MKSYPLLAAPAVHLALLVTAAAPNARCQVSFFHTSDLRGELSKHG